MAGQALNGGIAYVEKRSGKKKTLEFKNINGRAPRQLWTLPYACEHFSKELAHIQNDFPDDIAEVPAAFKQYRTPLPIKGGFYEPGEYVDEWGAVFTNLEKGIIGEVKKPVICREDWSDAKKVHIPEELLTVDTGKINEFCSLTDSFVLSGDLARPFERLQFLRGTADLLCDLANPPVKMLEFIEKMHDFYLRMLTVWAKTDIDGLFVMDDWGSQLNLLISPPVWVRLFKPMYRDYSDLAKKYNKKIFFHSDGNTEKIISHLIDTGIDAINIQAFCIGPERLAQYKGKVTFWGEVDRQNILPYGGKQEVYDAVDRLHAACWKDGGAIAQCEFGIGADPDNVYSVFERWNMLTI